MRKLQCNIGGGSERSTAVAAYSVLERQIDATTDASHMMSPVSKLSHVSPSETKEARILLPLPISNDKIRYEPRLGIERGPREREADK